MSVRFMGRFNLDWLQIDVRWLTDKGGEIEFPRKLNDQRDGVSKLTLCIA